MELVTTILASPEVQTALIGLIGAAVAFFVGRAAIAFEAATTIQISAEQRALYKETIMSAVESGLAKGLTEGTETFKAHVIAHLRESSPAAFAKMSPLPDVLDRHIYAATIKAISRLGQAT